MKKALNFQNGRGGEDLLHKIFFVVVLGVLVYCAYVVFMGRREEFGTICAAFLSSDPTRRCCINCSNKNIDLADQCLNECMKNPNYQTTT